MDDLSDINCRVSDPLNIIGSLVFRDMNQATECLYRALMSHSYNSDCARMMLEISTPWRKLCHLWPVNTEQQRKVLFIENSHSLKHSRNASYGVADVFLFACITVVPKDRPKAEDIFLLAKEESQLTFSLGRKWLTVLCV